MDKSILIQTIVRMCCKCRKFMGIDSHDQSKNSEKFIGISHGYCEKCYKEEMEKIKKEK